MTLSKFDPKRIEISLKDLKIVMTGNVPSWIWELDSWLLRATETDGGQEVVILRELQEILFASPNYVQSLLNPDFDVDRYAQFLAINATDSAVRYLALPKLNYMVSVGPEKCSASIGVGDPGEEPTAHAKTEALAFAAAIGFVARRMYSYFQVAHVQVESRRH